jgi:hypothetical protein
MSTQAFVDVIERWVNEPAFREELKKDPEQTVLNCGVELEEEEWAAIRSVVLFS